MTQLSLDLSGEAAGGRAAFFVSPSNRDALAAVDAGGWARGRLALIGPESAGKTHLARVWAGSAGAVVLDAGALADAAVPGLAGAALVLEDADRSIPGDALREEALLHLINAAEEAGSPVLLTARTAPAHWGVRLPDLGSRLSAIQVARLLPPDDSLLAALFVKLFADRQLSPPPDLIHWLMSRVERSAREAARLVDLLDRAALAEQRPLTLPFARRILAADGT